MKRIIDLDENTAREFLLKEESYVNFDLPMYFKFQNLLNEVDKSLTGKRLSDFKKINPREFDNINYRILTNKDGRYSWRPFQLINPALYVSLVHKITEKDNWKTIINRYNEFQQNDKIECQSLPIISEIVNKTDRESQIFTWWQLIEQKSINLSLDYRYILQTDITDCYGSIYTHSIPWSIHSKEIAKKNRKSSLLGNDIDNHLQDMSYGQTNGIPQGSTLMDFIAEMVLGYVDLLLSEKLSELKIYDYKILRYRDDYRVFTNNPFEAEQITKALSEILSEMGLKLNTSKTEASDNVVKSSLKSDKRYWIANQRITGNKQKWLIQLHLLSEEFPNSGTLETQMRDLLKVVKESKRKDRNIETLISIVTDIAFRNPRVVPASIGIISYLLKQINKLTDKKKIIKRVYNKFQQIPNSGLLNIWLQRLTIKVDSSLRYNELICKKVFDKNEQIWNTEWLIDDLKNKIENTPIIIESKVKTLKAVISKSEHRRMTRKKAYDYE
ncbi:MAG: RNA-directed DNA polymerase [Draconibacterium sp.]